MARTATVFHTSIRGTRAGGWGDTAGGWAGTPEVEVMQGWTVKKAEGLVNKMDRARGPGGGHGVSRGRAPKSVPQKLIIASAGWRAGGG